MITRRIAALVLAASAALALAGCGGNAGAGGTDGTATALRLGYFANFTHAPAIVGVEDGLFTKALGTTTLSTNVFDAGPAATEALLSGSIDAAFIGPGPTTNAYVKSKAITVIAGAAANGAALVVKPSITSVAQLKGAKLATPQLGNTQDIALRYWLKQHGLSTTTTGGGDVSILPQKNGDAVTAFEQGQIDGAWLPEPYATELVNAGGKTLVDESSLWPHQQFVVTNLVVRTDYLKRYPHTVTALLKGLVAAEQKIADDPSGTQSTTNDAIGRITGKPLESSVLMVAWENVDFTVDPIASSLLTGAQHAKDVGLLSGDITGLKRVYDLRPLNAVLKADGQPQVSAG